MARQLRSVPVAARPAGGVQPSGVKPGGQRIERSPPVTITTPKSTPKTWRADDTPASAIRYDATGGTSTELIP